MATLVSDAASTPQDRSRRVAALRSFQIEGCSGGAIAWPTAPGRRFLWITPEVLTDGKNTLLANGFWGVSRHVNYLGEITQAAAIALATGYFPTPYVALMLTR